MWKPAFMASLSYTQMAPQEVVHSLAHLGYQAVEWTLSHFNPRTHTETELKGLVDITHQAGLDISEVVVQQDVVCLDETRRQDRIALCLECIAAAAACGVSTLNFFSGPAPWDPAAPQVGRNISLGQAWGQILDAYDRFVRAAEEHRVKIAVEGVWGMVCHDYYSTLKLIEHYDSPTLGVNLDPSHDILVGNLDSGWIARQWGRERIHHVHLKDAVGTPQPGQFLFPMLGEGLVPWNDFFRALDEIGYAGYCSVEFESFAYHDRVLKGDTQEAARLSMEQIRQLLEPSVGEEIRSTHTRPL
jgi:sugar phosphate isomerase/epimerase